VPQWPGPTALNLSPRSRGLRPERRSDSQVAWTRRVHSGRRSHLYRGGSLAVCQDDAPVAALKFRPWVEAQLA
jgi:hypothetical protein